MNGFLIIEKDSTFVFIFPVVTTGVLFYVDIMGSPDIEGFGISRTVERKCGPWEVIMQKTWSGVTMIQVWVKNYEVLALLPPPPNL